MFISHKIKTSPNTSVNVDNLDLHQGQLQVSCHNQVVSCSQASRIPYSYRCNLLSKRYKPALQNLFELM